MHLFRHPQSPTRFALMATAIVAFGAAAAGLGAQPAQETVEAKVEPKVERPSRGVMLYVTPFISASWGQTLKTPKAWPRTAGGYASRVGDQFGFLIVEEGVKHLVDRAVPWVDDRSTCLKNPVSFAREVITRFGCAVARTSTMRTTEGELRPNLPFISGALIGTGASLTWRPERSSAVSSRAFVVQRLGITYGATALVRMITDWRADSKAGR